jgi:hypothetical protein
MSWLKDWLRAKVRDDVKHAELDRREQRTEEQVSGLREERLRNGFGELFGDAGLGKGH